MSDFEFLCPWCLQERGAYERASYLIAGNATCADHVGRRRSAETSPDYEAATEAAYTAMKTYRIEDPKQIARVAVDAALADYLTMSQPPNPLRI